MKLLERIFADRDLTAAVTEGEAGCPTQLPLLLADDTLDLVLADATGPARITRSEPVDGHACDRIVIPRPDGELVLWIDRRALARQAGEPPFPHIWALLRDISFWVIPSGCLSLIFESAPVWFGWALIALGLALTLLFWALQIREDGRLRILASH